MLNRDPQRHGSHVGRSTRAGCPGTLVHAHALHGLSCGFNSCDTSRVVVRTCKCMGCTGWCKRTGCTTEICGNCCQHGFC